MPFIASIILLALIVVVVGRGCLILALHLQSLLDISADSPSLTGSADGSVADSVCNKLMGRRVVAAQLSCSRVACCTGAAAARGRAGEARREAHASIPRRTLAARH